MHKLRDLNPFHERFGYLSLVAIGIAVLALGLLLRSDLFLSVVNFVLELLGWVGILGGVAVAAAGVVAHGQQNGWWEGIIERSGQSGKRFPMIRGPVQLRCVPARASILLPALDDHKLLRRGAGHGVRNRHHGHNPGGRHSIGRGGRRLRHRRRAGQRSRAAVRRGACSCNCRSVALFFLPEGQGRYIRAGLAGAGLVCILAFVFLTLSSTASELGVGIGELGDAGVGIGWQIGFWLSLLALVVAVVLQLVPMPFADEEKPQGGNGDLNPGQRGTPEIGDDPDGEG